MHRRAFAKSNCGVVGTLPNVDICSIFESVRILIGPLHLRPCSALVLQDTFIRAISFVQFVALVLLNTYGYKQTQSTVG